MVEPAAGFVLTAFTRKIAKGSRTAESSFASVMRYRRDRIPEARIRLGSAVPWYELAFPPFDPTLRISKTLSYIAGDYYLQDAGSLLALAAMGADRDDADNAVRGKVVCDLCAAPGGKASAILEAIGERGFLLANEPIGNRVAPLSFNLARTGNDNYAISRMDPQKLCRRIGGVFDLVLVDAPCSGQAMIQQGKQTVGANRDETVAYNAVRQNRILDAAVQLLRPGGRLVYSTCTFSEAENELQMARLCDSGATNRSAVPRLSGHETDAGCYRLTPGKDGCGGAFAASVTVESTGRDVRHKRIRDDRISNDQWSGWLNELPNQRWLIRKDNLLGFASNSPDWALEVAVDGPTWARRRGTTWRPHQWLANHSLQMPASHLRSGPLEISDEVAIEFVAGGVIPVVDRQPGWRVVRWRGRSLGWIKSDGRIGKNHLPSAMRQNGAITGDA